ncbi:anti-sigma-F factor Fin [Shouchella lonarensis]|uniref:Anti-sigma-F factor Fin n=1 Tax=Shouchella lonarensis TaxID=1464122 RepID=A0A1G6P010_9BACI|nr:anti-sigma-F factor Fin [Shouchella lonarensis]SDC72777.1 Protein of unknown function [Shouchella lonarensis]
MIHYHCRHCNHLLGSVANDTSLSALGFSNLTIAEQQALLTYIQNGDIQVKTICEHCHAALEQQPELYMLPNFIQ